MSGSEPLHPGVHLRKLMDSHQLSGRVLANSIGVNQMRITRILAGALGITVDTALRFGRFFDQPPEYWLDLQQRYDLHLDKKKAATIRSNVPRLAELVRPVRSPRKAPDAKRGR